MDVINKTSYALPVHQFDIPDDEDVVSREPQPPESDDEDRIIVKSYEAQYGLPHITAVAFIDGEREEYNFRVTDETLQWCSYSGRAPPEDIPIDVLHAVHDFGYGVKNVVTLGEWFTAWSISQEVLQMFIRLHESDDPLVSEFGRLNASFVDGLVIALLLKYELPDDEYENLWVGDYIEDASLKFGPLKRKLWEKVDAIDTPLVGPTDGSVEMMNIGYAVEEYEKPGNSLIAVDVVSPFGVERFAFENHGQDACVYIGSGSSSRPHPQVIKAVTSRGREVKNVSSVSQADTSYEAVEEAVSFYNSLAENPPVETNDKTNLFIASLKAMTMTATYQFQALFAATEYPEQYKSREKQVLEHTGVTRGDLQNMGADTLSELLSAVLQLLPEEAADRIPSRVRQSSSFSGPLGGGVDWGDSE